METARSMAARAVKTIRCSNCARDILVDDADYAAMVKYTWRAHWQRSGDAHARRSTLLADGAGHGTGIFMHRQLLGYPDTRLDVDHINGNGLDNRRDNLRLVTHKQNVRNAIRPKRRLVGRPGVTFDRRTGLWVARLNRRDTERRDFHLGSYRDELAATVVRSWAAALSNAELDAAFPVGVYRPPKTTKTADDRRARRALMARNRRRLNPEAGRAASRRYRLKRLALTQE